MCTCMNFKSFDYYFGRTMDLEYSFNERIVITPRNYHFNLKAMDDFNSKYAFIGAATIINDYPLYAEATNEMGLSVACLNFPDNAYYREVNSDSINLAPYEIIPWILGNFSSVEELGYVINDINIINVNFSSELAVSPLHWMICDKYHCLVLEATRSGVEVYFNSIGILTNNPPFNYHLTNINNYLNLTPDLTGNRFSKKIKLSSYSLGMGAIGLPGDTSSTSRFVRAAFNKLNSVPEDNEEDSVGQFFHILDSVSVVKGTTMTEDKKWNVTLYSCCVNISRGIYYYKTYTNNQIGAIKMTEDNMNSLTLTSFDFVNEQQIKYFN